MTNRLELNWKLDGFVDEQRYYCSETPIDVNNLPPPAEILSSDARTYIDDTQRMMGKKYHVRIGTVKNGIEKISDEEAILFGEAWKPQNLTNPAKLIYNSENVVKDGSNQISQITDLSRNNYHATQSVGSNKPILQDDVKFDGVDDFLSLSGTALSIFSNVSGSFIFAVFKKNSIDLNDTERPVFSVSTNGGSSKLGLFAGMSRAGMKNRICLATRRLDSDAYDGIDSTFECVANRYYIACGVVDYVARTAKLFIDGVQVVAKTGMFTASGNTSSTNSTNSRVGANSAITASTFCDMNLKSLISSSYTIGDTDRQKLEGWAAHKYGLTANLPIDHPYKILIPTS